VPFARYISEHFNEVGLPFKRWAVGNVFRGENTQAGRYREFTQCDFDFVGTTSLASDAEIVQVIDASMRALGVERFQIRVNNRKVMNGLIAALGMADKAADVLQEIDKIEKVGPAAVRAALENEHGFSPDAASRPLDFVDISRGELSPAKVLEATNTFRALHPLLEQGLKELEELDKLLTGVGIAYPTYRVDLSIARGLGYYTGIVYETILLDRPSIGSVCSGGRYDNLTQTFRKEPCPGVGASVGIDRLIAGLEALGVIKKIGTPAKVLVLMPSEEHLLESLEIGNALRNAGVATEVYPEPHKIKRQIGYAERHGHPLIIIPSKKGEGFSVERMSDHQKFNLTSVDEIIARKDEFLDKD